MSLTLFFSSKVLIDGNQARYSLMMLKSNEIIYNWIRKQGSHKAAIKLTSGLGQVGDFSLTGSVPYLTIEKHWPLGQDFII